MRIFFLLLLFLPVAGLQAQHRLVITPVMPGFWVHTSYGKYQNSYFPANGLIVENSHSVLIVDTGWGEKPARKLIRWVRKHLHKPIELVVITHSHEDRAGGIRVFQQHKIPLMLSSRTTTLLQQQHIDLGPVLTAKELPGPGGGRQAGDAGWEPADQDFVWLYPGAGHAPDNIVVYFKKAHLLFGGCLVKSMEAQNLGNLAEANLQEWPGSIRYVQAAFPEARIVIPGHQAWGGPELLDHTLKLLETSPK